MPTSRAETFRLYLVRHARAGWGTPGVSDFDRPLDDIGRLEAREIAEQAMLAGFIPDALVSSPALRCRQTTAVLLDVFRAVRPREEMALYSGGPEDYLEQIRKYADKPSLMIVGHNPMIEVCAQRLPVTSDVLLPLSLGYPTAGLLVMEFTRPLAHQLAHHAEAVALITPSLT